MKKDDVHTMRIPKGDDREKGPEEIPEAVTTENFHKIKGKKRGRVKFRIFHRVTRRESPCPLPGTIS